VVSRGVDTLARPCPDGSEPVEEVFAVGVDGPQDLAVDQRRALGHAPLGRGHGHRLPAEVPRVIAGETVDGVAFGHG
jgi:hypothetical protein